MSDATSTYVFDPTLHGIDQNVSTENIEKAVKLFLGTNGALKEMSGDNDESASSKQIKDSFLADEGLSKTAKLLMATVQEMLTGTMADIPGLSVHLFAALAELRGDVKETMDSEVREAIAELDRPVDVSLVEKLKAEATAQKTFATNLVTMAGMFNVALPANAKSFVKDGSFSLPKIGGPRLGNANTPTPNGETRKNSKNAIPEFHINGERYIYNNGETTFKRAVNAWSDNKSTVADTRKLFDPADWGKKVITLTHDETGKVLEVMPLS